MLCTFSFFLSWIILLSTSVDTDHSTVLWFCIECLPALDMTLHQKRMNSHYHSVFSECVSSMESWIVGVKENIPTKWMNQICYDLKRHGQYDMLNDLERHSQYLINNKPLLNCIGFLPNSPKIPTFVADAGTLSMNIQNFRCKTSISIFFLAWNP